MTRNDANFGIWNTCVFDDSSRFLTFPQTAWRTLSTTVSVITHISFLLHITLYFGPQAFNFRHAHLLFIIIVIFHHYLYCGYDFFLHICSHAVSNRLCKSTLWYIYAYQYWCYTHFYLYSCIVLHTHLKNLNILIHSVYYSNNCSCFLCVIHI